MQAKVSRSFTLLVTQGTNRVALYPLDEQDIRRMNLFLNEKPCKETMFSFGLCLPDRTTIERAKPPYKLSAIRQL